MRGKSKELEQIELFLNILENRIQELWRSMSALPERVEDLRGSLRFADYVSNRDLSSECWAFSIVIERRIEEYQGNDSPELRRRFDMLTVMLWSTLLDCSLRFLDALSREEHLPLGSREIFVREIKTLYDAHRLLTESRYSDFVTENMRNRQAQAERILTEIIDRAPALLNLGP